LKPFEKFAIFTNFHGPKKFQNGLEPVSRPWRMNTFHILKPSYKYDKYHRDSEIKLYEYEILLLDPSLPF
jgi:hypothetical protein